MRTRLANLLPGAGAETDEGKGTADTRANHKHSNVRVHDHTGNRVKH